MTKTIDTLVADIYELFENGHEISQEGAKEFGESVAKAIGDRLLEAKTPRRGGSLRMSNIGRRDRQLWYEVNYSGPSETLRPEAKIKFLFGDILELLLLFLASEAGHRVTDRQATVELDGIKGSIDAEIDGATIDTKSASSFSFKKFEDGDLWDDPFGYEHQLQGYREARGTPRAAFLVIDKTLGKIALYEPPTGTVGDRIKHIKEVVAKPEPPVRCYDPVPDGKSGNLKLGVGCSYCPFKDECWKDANGGVGLRTYIYSTGPKFLVKVEREPNVTEIT